MDWSRYFPNTRFNLRFLRKDWDDSLLWLIGVDAWLDSVMGRTLRFFFGSLREIGACLLYSWLLLPKTIWCTYMWFLDVSSITCENEITTCFCCFVFIFIFHHFFFNLWCKNDMGLWVLIFSWNQKCFITFFFF